MHAYFKVFENLYFSDELVRARKQKAIINQVLSTIHLFLTVMHTYVYLSERWTKCEDRHRKNKNQI